MIAEKRIEIKISRKGLQCLDEPRSLQIKKHRKKERRTLSQDSGISRIKCRASVIGFGLLPHLINLKDPKNQTLKNTQQKLTNRRGYRPGRRHRGKETRANRGSSHSPTEETEAAEWEQTQRSSHG